MPLITRLPADRAIIVIELFWQGGRALCDGPLGIPILADAALQPGPFVLGGISLGGMITVEIAGLNPSHLIGAIPMEGWPHHSVAETAFQNLVRTPLEPDQEQQRLADRHRHLSHLSSEQQSTIRTIWRQWNGTDALLRMPVRH